MTTRWVDPFTRRRRLRRERFISRTPESYNITINMNYLVNGNRFFMKFRIRPRVLLDYDVKNTMSKLIQNPRTQCFIQNVIYTHKNYGLQFTGSGMVQKCNRSGNPSAGKYRGPARSTSRELAALSTGENLASFACNTSQLLTELGPCMWVRRHLRGATRANSGVCCRGRGGGAAWGIFNF